MTDFLALAQSVSERWQEADGAIPSFVVGTVGPALFAPRVPPPGQRTSGGPLWPGTELVDRDRNGEK